MNKINHSFYSRHRVIFPLVLTGLFVCGCQESEFNLDTYESNPYEADIQYIRFSNPDMLKVESDTMFRVFNDVPEVPVNINADMQNIAPQFVLTSGSEIFMQDTNGEWTLPANGVSRDFSEGGQKYMVVSANKQSHHIYTLSFNCQEVATEYHFERFELNDSTMNEDGSLKKNIAHYYIWKEYDTDGTYKMSWASGNPGYGISKVNNSPDNYPTTPCEGVDGGKGVKLTTMDTGGIAAMMNMRLAAGNIFLGEFDVSTALKDARASTRFGVPFNNKPLQLRGWMSYTPGEKYQDRNGHIIDRADSCDIYALIYRNKDENGNTVVLDGNTIPDSPYIVGKARLNDTLAAGTNGEWVYFTADFDYDSYPMELVPEYISGYGYNLVVVGSSSRQGAFFCGAIGSTLKIDELEVICEK
ncbi:MAG: PCMD domain-containing protein [Bacteroides sp.]|nr:PCMD domain-containing protein [Roseburia sp.]MCM1347213.1 PCMD domain-containing protein [Bacteroides sp.]MCM1420570.1 PCMD domain-containing protein [Bacteroides sp.]